MRRRAARVLRAVVIGVATLFAAKTEREQHWSTPPTMIVQRKDVDDENGDGPTPPFRLPSCA
jgi:hypothetical protein